LGSREFKRALYYCQKADALVPGSEEVLAKFTNVYELDQQWDHAKNTSHSLIKRFPASPGITKYYRTYVSSMVYLGHPVADIIPILREYVRLRSKLHDPSTNTIWVRTSIHLISVVIFIRGICSGHRSRLRDVHKNVLGRFAGFSSSETDFHRTAIDLLSKHEPQ
jgi:hypothetical protein